MKHILTNYALRFLSFFFLLLPVCSLTAQPVRKRVEPPVAADFVPILRFLSSGWMEGREAGSRGGFMAADYIASMMQVNRLLPYGHPDGTMGNTKGTGGKNDYFQDFYLTRVNVENSSLALISRNQEGESALIFNPGLDYSVPPVPRSCEGEARLFFGGYGIKAPEKQYDDYRGLDIKGRIVVILEGYPGHLDTTAPVRSLLGKNFGEKFASRDTKISTARQQGALAVILVDPSGPEIVLRQTVVNTDQAERCMVPVNRGDPVYNDGEYALFGDTTACTIPCFTVGRKVATELLKSSNINLEKFEIQSAGHLTNASALLPGHRVRFGVTIKAETLLARNVVGMIRGLDTTRYILVGAHYDHLGTRDAVTYYGADDNASGTAGMLSLAAKWSSIPEKPACNLLFAAWTAEEKGILGSTFFCGTSPVVGEKLSLVINMDMLSRNDVTDTAGRQISIGTLPVSEDLRKLARASNDLLNNPFQLDFWDVTGHSGSDYGAFAARKIPVMTFFSGFHADYHSPRDVAEKTDPLKMERILSIVNHCLQEATLKSPVR